MNFIMNTHPNYPKRVFSDPAVYNINCPYYEDESVKKNEGIWADFSNITDTELYERLIWKDNKLITLHEAKINFIHGKPVTPIKTGIKGRGMLGKYGPNHAADPIVTRINPRTQDVEFIAAKRLDTDQYCIPGGMVDPGEPRSLTLRREFEEEVASNCDKEVLDKVFANGKLLYAGPTYNDPRTTDNAWIETYVMHYHISGSTARKLKLTPQLSENSKVKWISCRHPNLYGDHAKYVHMAEQDVILNYIYRSLLNIVVITVVITLILMFYLS